MSWINNYDDPEEMDIATALRLLQLNGFKNITGESNKERNANVAYVFDNPYSAGAHHCHDDEEVINLAIEWQLTEPEVAQ